MLETSAWHLGDTAQRAWAEQMRQRGYAVLPAYAFEEIVPETKAPVLLVPGGLRVAPDLLCLHPTRGARWHEVKAKSQPSWRYTHRRWEHGIDWHLAEEYRRAQAETGVPVLLIVQETISPLNPERLSPLVPQDVWLVLDLDRAFRKGEHRTDWPGGKAQPHNRGKYGRGGLLWPRRDMLAVALPAAFLVASRGLAHPPAALPPPAPRTDAAACSRQSLTEDAPPRPAGLDPRTAYAQLPLFPRAGAAAGKT